MFFSLKLVRFFQFFTWFLRQPELLPLFVPVHQLCPTGLAGLFNLCLGLNFICRNKCKCMAGLGAVEVVYRDCKYSLMPGVHGGVYFGRQIQVMFPYLEAWHSWGAWGTRWAQSWALQGTEITWCNRHTAHPGRLVFPPSHVDFGSKFTKLNGITALVTHKIMIYEWSAPL